jgi:hypothetical protein
MDAFGGIELKRENREINGLGETRHLADVAWKKFEEIRYLRRKCRIRARGSIRWVMRLKGLKWLKRVISMGCVGNVDWWDGEVGFGGKCGITGVF